MVPELASLRDIPNCPGIYGFHGADGGLLYLGKAKSLRARLGSYRRAGELAPPNVVEMLEHAVRLQWQELPTEKLARERESELLHVLQPPYNIAESWDADYPFIAVRFSTRHDGAGVRFRLTSHPEHEGFRIYGCYKHRPRAKAGYSALLRLIAVATTDDPRFYYPSRLTARKPAYDCRLPFRTEWQRALVALLDGQGVRFLRLLMEAALANAALPRLTYPTIRRDFEAAATFFRLGPRATRDLRRRHRKRSGPVTAREMNEWIARDWEASWNTNRLLR